MASREPAAEHDKRYYRIGEVARITGVKPYVLRYWESEFRWMAPQKSRSNQRLYRRKDIDTILLIKKLLYEQRFTIAGARRKLRELGLSRALSEGPELEPELPMDPRERFRRIREELESIRSALLA
jgi:DNA-binding transcriptional MerR regulator